MTKDTLIYWQPTSRKKLYLHIDNDHFRWTIFHPKDKDQKIVYRGTMLTKEKAIKIKNKLCGKLFFEGITL